MLDDVAMARGGVAVQLGWVARQFIDGAPVGLTAVDLGDGGGIEASKGVASVFVRTVDGRFGHQVDRWIGANETFSDGAVVEQI